MTIEISRSETERLYSCDAISRSGRGVALTDDKDVLEEINRLREDVRQLREVVNVLVNVVIEEDLEEDEDEFSTFVGKDGRFNLHN
jgi:hypothetical protein